MTWLEWMPTIGVTLLAVYLPGLALAFAMGARRFTLFATAPALSVAVIALSAIGLAELGITWGVVPVAALAVTAAAAVYLLRRGWRRPPPAEASPRGTRHAPWLALGVGAGTVLIVIQLVSVFGFPDAISQTFDAPFHLNGLRHIADTGSASSFDLTSLVLPEGRSSFYPAAWHGVASLVASLVAAPVAAVANGVNMVVASIVWVSGSVLLSRVIVPGSRVAPVAAGVLAAAFPAFPVLVLDYGVLYPYFLGLALLPVALALTISVARLGGRVEFGRGLQVPALGLTVVACALAQPSVALSWGALTVPIAVAWFVLFLTRRPRPLHAVLLGIGLLVVIGLLAGAWILAGRMGLSAPWGPHAGPLRGIYEVVAHAPTGRPAAVLASVLVVIGLLALVIRREKLWLVAAWAIPAVLYFVASVVASLPIRTLLTGVFYNDAPRLASLIVILSVPVAVVGAVALCSLARRIVWPRIAERLPRGPLVPVVAAVVAAALLVAGTQGAAVRYEVWEASKKYGFDGWVAILSEDEFELLERLPDLVEESAVIAGSPWTGTSLAYAIADREVVSPHFSFSRDPNKVIINTRLNEARNDPEVCSALRDLRVEYVLDFGRLAGDVGHDRGFDGLEQYPGLVGLASSGVVELVDREGAARLYRITAC